MKRLTIPKLSLSLVALLALPALAKADTSAPPKHAQAKATSTHKATAKPAAAAGPKSSNLVDINKASKEQLMALGIEEADAQKIIAGRPYQAKTALLHNHLIPSATYTRIKGQLTAKQ